MPSKGPALVCTRCKAAPPTVWHPRGRAAEAGTVKRYVCEACAAELDLEAEAELEEEGN